jgi:hypothetical protein
MKVVGRGYSNIFDERYHKKNIFDMVIVFVWIPYNNRCKQLYSTIIIYKYNGSSILSQINIATYTVC